MRFAFLERDRPAVGRVLYPGALPPPLDQLNVLSPPVTWTRKTPAQEHVWEVEATHPKWGTVDLACHRDGSALPDVLIDHTLALSETEKARARLGQAAIGVRVHTCPRRVLADRKRLLFWKSQAGRKSADPGADNQGCPWSWHIAPAWM